MNAELPHILVPLTELGEVDGAVIVATTVELWPDRVLVRAVELPNEGGKLTAPEGDPASPNHRWLPALYLSDEESTPYRLSSGSIGGTDTTESMTWIFRPGMPADVRHLTVRLGEPGGEPMLLTR
ncbi:hypothetical protein [Streptomyces bauhiniae]|uniref:hypothetical protein n=1 Tax=Streptomyces bauhiniae TaxID=2340725 RepID=UPI003452186A